MWLEKLLYGVVVILKHANIGSVSTYIYVKCVREIPVKFKVPLLGVRFFGCPFFEYCGNFRRLLPVFVFFGSFEVNSHQSQKHPKHNISEREFWSDVEHCHYVQSAPQGMLLFYQRSNFLHRSIGAIW